jgi:hypothetical protein
MHYIEIDYSKIKTRGVRTHVGFDFKASLFFNDGENLFIENCEV